MESCQYPIRIRKPFHIIRWKCFAFMSGQGNL